MSLAGLRDSAIASRTAAGGWLPGLLVAAALLLGALPASGAGLGRLAGESERDFVTRLAPAGLPLLHLASETGASGALAAFYEQEFEQDGQSYRRLLGRVFQPEARGRYRLHRLDSLEPEGGSPEIEAAFFTSARAGRPALLVVLCSWPQVHHDYQGRLYATQVYRLPRPGSKAVRLQHERQLESRLEGGCECDWSDGTHSSARHRSEAELRATLAGLGL